MSAYLATRSLALEAEDALALNIIRYYWKYGLCQGSTLPLGTTEDCNAPIWEDYLGFWADLSADG